MMLLHSRHSPVPVIDSDRDDWWRLARCAAPDRDMWTSDNMGDKLAAAHQCIAHCPVLARCHAEAEDLGAACAAVGGLVYGYDGQPLDLEPPRYCAQCRPLPPLTQRTASCRYCGQEFVTEHPLRRYCWTDECERARWRESKRKRAAMETVPR